MGTAAPLRVSFVGTAAMFEQHYFGGSEVESHAALTRSVAVGSDVMTFRCGWAGKFRFPSLRREIFYGKGPCNLGPP